MDQPTKHPQHEPNPKTRSAHRKETFWQIIFPMVAAIVFLSSIAIIIAINEVGTVSLWADIALIIMILPAMIIMIFPLIIIVLLIIGSSRIMAIIPGYAHQVHKFFRKIRMRTTEYSDIAVKPVINLISISTIIRTKRGSEVQTDIQDIELH